MLARSMSCISQLSLTGAVIENCGRRPRAELAPNIFLDGCWGMRGCSDCDSTAGFPGGAGYAVGSVGRSRGCGQGKEGVYRTLGGLSPSAASAARSRPLEPGSVVRSSISAVVRFSIFRNTNVIVARAALIPVVKWRPKFAQTRTMARVRYRSQ
jgi:hypothetical protein